MTWHLSNTPLLPSQHIRYGNDGNEYRVAKVSPGGVDIECIAGPAKGRDCLPISLCSEVERMER